MEIGSVKRIHQSDWKNSGIRFFRARDIIAISKNEDVKDKIYISSETYNKFSSISGKVKIGDLLVTGVGSIGVPMLIVSEVPIYFKDGNIIWFKNRNILDGKFFYYEFTTRTIQSFINKSSGIGTVGTYTIDNGKKTPIIFPFKSEQDKIGNLLSKLDNNLSLLQRKVEYLRVCLTNELKELILHSVPTQTVMFNDIIDTISLKNYITKENINNGKYNILQQGDDPNFGFSNMIPYKNYEKVILFGDHTLSIYKPKSPFLVSTDGVKGITSATIDIKFLHLLLVLFKPKSQGYKRHLSILKDTKVTFPKDKDIQIKLGKLFYKEQNYLKQEENRIHELKKLKQFLLQNMFI